VSGCIISSDSSLNGSSPKANTQPRDTNSDTKKTFKEIIAGDFNTLRYIKLDITNLVNGDWGKYDEIKISSDSKKSEISFFNENNQDTEINYLVSAKDDFLKILYIKEGTVIDSQRVLIK
jgi:hypothetical protein